VQEHEQGENDHDKYRVKAAFLFHGRHLLDLGITVRMKTVYNKNRSPSKVILRPPGMKKTIHPGSRPFFLFRKHPPRGRSDFLTIKSVYDCSVIHASDPIPKEDSPV
jgi:hypothetical protein